MLNENDCINFSKKNRKLCVSKTSRMADICDILDSQLVELPIRTIGCDGRAVSIDRRPWLGVCARLFVTQFYNLLRLHDRHDQALSACEFFFPPHTQRAALVAADEKSFETRDDERLTYRERIKRQKKAKKKQASHKQPTHACDFESYF